MIGRDALKADFLSQSGWANASRILIAGDASNRKYERLTMDGATAVLMDAPPDKGEDVRPFISIANHLKTIGLSAPEILFQDGRNGFLLIEDLGDDLFARVLEVSPTLEPVLYRAATDVLVSLHKAPLPEVAAYDTAIMTEMAGLSYIWYAKHAGDIDYENHDVTFKAEFAPILDMHTSASQVLIQRDYHAENLLWLPDRNGVAKVGLLDFQDAMIGHSAYDLVSVLQDARRDVSLQTEAEMIAHYCAETGTDEDAFRASYAVLGVQRNLRILGVFVRLCVRDGKAHYVDFIPRVWKFLLRNLDHPALASVAQTVLRDLPEPTIDALERIKAKCPIRLDQ
jgi:aminoglycoside/choline kinase family phosphotransferase